MSGLPGSAEPQLRNNNKWRSRGYLPHRDRIGLLQSITFHLLDSLSQEKLRELEREEAELGLRIPRLRVSGVWMADYWDRYIRDEKHLKSVVDYNTQQPGQSGFVQEGNRLAMEQRIRR